jgi:hypothetical protein
MSIKHEFLTLALHMHDNPPLFPLPLKNLKQSIGASLTARFCASLQLCNPTEQNVPPPVQ